MLVESNRKESRLLVVLDLGKRRRSFAGVGFLAESVRQPTKAEAECHGLQQAPGWNAASSCLNKDHQALEKLRQ
jgi:hypothetical protein